MGSETPRVGLRERKKRQTKDRLEAVALQMFEERGFDAVTVDDIAAAANVSPRTFFRYYPSKADVLSKDVAETMESLVADLESMPPGEPALAAVGRVLMAYADESDSLPRLQRQRSIVHIVTEAPHLAPGLLGKMASKHEELTAAIARRRGTDAGSDLYAHLLAACTAGALRVSLELAENSTPRRSAADLIAEALDILARGFDTTHASDAAGHDTARE
jgi:AcrR family transcriptional regulator